MEIQSHFVDLRGVEQVFVGLRAESSLFLPKDAEN